MLLLLSYYRLVVPQELVMFIKETLCWSVMEKRCSLYTFCICVPSVCVGVNIFNMHFSWVGVRDKRVRNNAAVLL